MEERDYLIELYDLYKGLLTKKQKEYFELVYFDDLTRAEIGETEKVSKANVSKIILNVERKLKKYEKELKLYDMNISILKIIEKTSNNSLKAELLKLLER